MFPPRDAAGVKAIAGAAVSQTAWPWSRVSRADRATQASAAVGQPISRPTVGRSLAAAALKPWRDADGMFPRDPQGEAKAGRGLERDAGVWHGKPLGPHDSRLSAEDKTSRQARRRCQASVRPAPGRPRRVEHEDDRGGALPSLAAWEVQRGEVMGRGAPQTGSAPLGRRVTQGMEPEPSRSAERVCWVVDTGSAPRGQSAGRRWGQTSANARVVPTPVHASGLNHVAIAFALVQRQVLTPNDVASVADVEPRLRLSEALSNPPPRPLAWKFTRAKLAECLKRLAAHGVIMHESQADQELPDTDQAEPFAA